MAKPSMHMNNQCNSSSKLNSCSLENLSALTIHPIGYVPIKSSNSTFVAQISSIFDSNIVPPLSMTINGISISEKIRNITKEYAPYNPTAKLLKEDIAVTIPKPLRF